MKRTLSKMHQSVSYSFEELPEREAFIQSNLMGDKSLAMMVPKVKEIDEKESALNLADFSFGEEQKQHLGEEQVDLSGKDRKYRIINSRESGKILSKTFDVKLDLISEDDCESSSMAPLLVLPDEQQSPLLRCVTNVEDI